MSADPEVAFASSATQRHLCPTLVPVDALAPVLWQALLAAVRLHGGHLLGRAKAEAEHQAPVHQQQGEEVPKVVGPLGQIEDEAVCLLRPDLQADVSVEPDAGLQLYSHIGVVT